MIANDSQNGLILRGGCGIMVILLGFKSIPRPFFLFLRLLCENLIVYLCPGTSYLKWLDIGYPSRFQVYQGIFILGDTKSARRLCHA